jgi:phage-related protein
MAVSENLLIKIQADTSGISKGVKELGKSMGDLSKNMGDASKESENFGKKLSGVSLSIISLNQAFELAGKAINAMIGPIQASIKAFTIQDSAERKVANSLRLVGQNSEATMQSFKKFTSELQNNSRFGDEVTLNLVAMSKAMGLSDNQTKKLIQTSADLAAVTGQDITSAYKELKGQFSGAAGRMAKLAPELKNLTQEQLMAGKGIEILGAKFAGFAKSEAATLEGSLVQLQNAYGDLQEGIGKLVVDILHLPKIFKHLMNAVISLQGGIANLSERFKVFKETLSGLKMETIAAAATKLGVAFAAVALVFAGPALAGAVAALGAMIAPIILITAKFILMAGAVIAVVVAIETLIKNMNNLPALGTVMADAWDNAFARMKRGVSGLITGALLGFESLLEMIAPFSTLADKALVSLRNSIQKFGDDIGDANDEVEILNQNLSKSASKLKTGAVLDAMLTGINAISAATGDVNIKTEDLSKTYKDLGGTLQNATDASNAFLSVFRSLNIENINLAQQLGTADDDRNAQIQNALNLEMISLALKREEIALSNEFNESEKTALLDQLALKEKLLKEKAAKETTTVVSINSITAGLNEAFAAGSGLFASIQSKGFPSIIPSGEDIAAMGKTIGDGIKNADLSKVGSAMMSGIGSMVSGIASMFNPDNINKFADMIGNTMSQLPDMMIKAFDALDQALTKFIEVFPDMIQNMMAALPGIIQKLMDQLPAFITALIDGLMSFVDMLPQIFQSIFDKLPGIISLLVKALPKLITKILSAVGQIISSFIGAIPEILKELIDGLPAFIEALITGIMDMMGMIVGAFVDFLIGGGLEKIIGAFIRMIPKLIVAIVNGLIKGLAKFFKNIFKGFKIGGLDKVQELPGKFAEGVKNLSKSVAKETSQVFKVLDLEKEGKILEKSVTDPKGAVKDAAALVGKEVTGIWTKLMAMLGSAWNKIRSGFMKIVEAFLKIREAVYKLFKPVTDALTKAFMWLKVNVLDKFASVFSGAGAAFGEVIESFRSMFTNAKELFSVLVDGIKSQFNNIKETFTKLLAAFGEAGNKIKEQFSGLIDIFKDSWNAIVDFFKNIFSGKIKEAFSGIFEAFKNIGGKIWENFKSGLEGAWKIYAKIGTTIFGGLKGGLEGAWKIYAKIGTTIWDSLKSGISNIGSMFKEAFDNLNPANLLEKVFKIDMGGKGTVEKAIGVDIPFTAFAKGGMVPGAPMVSGDSAMNDRILAMLSPGEAVIPRSKMNDPEIQKIVASIINGTFKPPGFFMGTSISKDGISVGGVKIGTDGTIKAENPLDKIKNVSNAIAAGDIKGAITAATGMSPDDMIAQFKDLIFNKLISGLKSTLGFSEGGIVPGFFNGTDNVSAMLTPGEFVVNRANAQKNLGLLNSINSGKAANVSGDTSIVVHINIEASSQNLDSGFIRNKLIPDIKKELKESSLRGEFLLSNRGLR